MSQRRAIKQKQNPMHEPRPKRGMRVAEAVLKRHGDAHEHNGRDAFDSTKDAQSLDNLLFHGAGLCRKRTAITIQDCHRPPIA